MDMKTMRAYLENLMKSATGGRPVDSFATKSIDKKVLTRFANVSLHIKFPGYKATANKPDYLVQLDKNGTSTNVSHEDIMCDLYDYVMMAPVANGHLAILLLSEIYSNWEDFDTSKFQPIKFNNFTLEEIIECICYISIQEEINYPQQKGYSGCKRPFYSYIEAIYAGNGSNLITMADAIHRCNSKLRFSPIPRIKYHDVIP